MFRRWSDGPRWFTVRKTDLLYKDVTFSLSFWCLFFLLFFFLFFFFSLPLLIGNLLNSSSTQFLVVLFFLAFYMAPFCSKHIFLGLLVRFLSTQLLFLVILLLLLLSMTAFSYVGLLSLFWERPFSHCFPEPSFTQLFSWGLSSERGSIHLLAFSARASSLAFLSLGVPFLAICRAVLIYSGFCCCCFLGGGGGVVLRPFSL